jgi:hypothetical protein
VSNAIQKPGPRATVCIFCKSRGICGKCEGRGVRESFGARRRGVKQMVTCAACEGSGVCQLCHGRGVVEHPVPPRPEP